jgi:hypothetical protein
VPEAGTIAPGVRLADILKRDAVVRNVMGASSSGKARRKDFETMYCRCK